MKNKGLVFLIWIITVLLAIANIRPVNAQTLNQICDGWGRLESAYMLLWADMWHSYNIPSAALPGLEAIGASDSFWVDTTDYGYFDTPDDETETHYKITLTTDEGRRHLYFTFAESTPETAYAYAFTSLKPTTDANGDHYGVHPCAVFKTDADLIHSLWTVTSENVDNLR